jgi:hypothetical protein
MHPSRSRERRRSRLATIRSGQALARIAAATRRSTANAALVSLDSPLAFRNELVSARCMLVTFADARCRRPAAALVSATEGHHLRVRAQQGDTVR